MVINKDKTCLNLVEQPSQCSSGAGWIRDVGQTTVEPRAFPTFHPFTTDPGNQTVEGTDVRGVFGSTE